MPGEEESLTERRDLLRNGEKYLSALSGADYCLNGGEGGRRRRLPPLRDAEEALAGVRTPRETWGSCTSAWNSCGVKPMTLPRSFGTSGRRSTSPLAELDAVESRSDLLYRLKKKYGATVEEMLAYLDKCRRELDDMETADDTWPGWNSSWRRPGRPSWQRGAELTAARKEAAAVLEQAASSPELRDLDMHKVRFAIDFGEKERAPTAVTPSGF